MFSTKLSEPALSRTVNVVFYYPEALSGSIIHNIIHPTTKTTTTSHENAERESLLCVSKETDVDRDRHNASQIQWLRHATRSIVTKLLLILLIIRHVFLLTKPICVVLFTDSHTQYYFIYISASNNIVK